MCSRKFTNAFTLIELLIVVAIIAILAAIGLNNYKMAMERTLKSSDASNLHTLATALQTYYVDNNRLPPADREAGPFMSHTKQYVAVGNGPAAGGCWDGVPWLLYEQKYISDWRTLFNPKYMKLFKGTKTLRGDYQRFHNFRYAYNSSAISTGGHLGGDGNVESGEVWIVRNLFVSPDKGWFKSSYPKYPADYKFPWGEGEWQDNLEHVMYSDMAVKTVIGGTNKSPDSPKAAK